MIPYVSCRRVREVLDEFYDGELPVADQVAVENHLRTCRECETATADLALIGEALRTESASHPMPSREKMAGVQAAAAQRARAEFDQSLPQRIGRMFEDLHLVWSALGACIATVACVVVASGVLQAAQQERPDSLAGLIEMLANPGSNSNPVRADGRVSLPRALPEDIVERAALHQPVAEEDAVFALAGVVTREGRVTNLEVLLSEGARRRDGSVADVLNALSRARYEPAQSGGSPVAVSMVWLLAHTTVRASGHPAALIPMPWHSIDDALPTAPRAPKPSVGTESGLRGDVMDSTTA